MLRGVPPSKCRLFCLVTIPIIKKGFAMKEDQEIKELENYIKLLKGKIVYLENNQKMIADN